MGKVVRGISEYPLAYVLAGVFGFLMGQLPGCYPRGVAGPELTTNWAEYAADMSHFDYVSLHTDSLGLVPYLKSLNPSLRIGLVTPQAEYSDADFDGVLALGLEYWCYGNELTVVDVAKLQAFHDKVAGRTKTCVTFHYETMTFTDFPSLSFLSFVAFTTYPWMKYADVTKIPSDYYSKLSSVHKYAITETSWPSVPYNGIIGNEDSQVLWSKRLNEDQYLKNSQYVAWFFLNDYEALPDQFKNQALRKIDHTPKKVYSVWKTK